MDWIKSNWDKLLTLLIGGIVGYFAGLAAINSKIADLRNDLTKVQTEIDSNIKVQITKIPTHENTLDDYLRRIDILEQADRAVAIYQINLESKLKQTEQETVRELKELIEKLTPPPATTK